MCYIRVFTTFWISGLLCETRGLHKNTVFYTVVDYLLDLWTPLGTLLADQLALRPLRTHCVLHALLLLSGSLDSCGSPSD